jgi:hypothetical protein
LNTEKGKRPDENLRGAGELAHRTGAPRHRPFPYQVSSTSSSCLRLMFLALGNAFWAAAGCQRKRRQHGVPAERTERARLLLVLRHDPARVRGDSVGIGRHLVRVGRDASL